MSDEAVCRSHGSAHKINHDDSHTTAPAVASDAILDPLRLIVCHTPVLLCAVNVHSQYIPVEYHRFAESLCGQVKSHASQYTSLVVHGKWIYILEGESDS